MKRLLLLVMIIGCSLLSACSTENNPADMILPVRNNYLKAKVNGIPMTFDKSDVVKQNVTENGANYTDLIITVSKKGDTSSKVVLRVQYMVTGTETCYYFLYNAGASEHDIENGDSFAVDVTQSTANNIKGTFSGTLADFESNTVSIEGGTFDISF